MNGDIRPAHPGGVNLEMLGFWRSPRRCNFGLVVFVFHVTSHSGPEQEERDGEEEEEEDREEKGSLICGPEEMNISKFPTSLI